MKYLIAVLTMTMIQISSYANISMPAIFSDHMVLQQNTEVTIWGWGKPGEVVEVSGSWQGAEKYSTTVENHSRWSVQIATPSAGGPFVLTVSGYNKIIIEDVLIGEVWLGSGQSNMEWSAHLGIYDAEKAKSMAHFPEIRFFTVLTSTASCPQQNFHGQWVKCTPESMYYFSALMYYFGKEIHSVLDVPVGLIHSSWGGTPIEVWIPQEQIESDEKINASSALLEEVSWCPVDPGVCYNAMIHPVIPYRIKGLLWYQGETNVGNPDLYSEKMQMLVESWRAGWGEELTFYYAQIAPWKGYGDDNVKGAILRDEQRIFESTTPGTAMVVTADIGDLDDIHPGNKKDVGIRMANLALYNNYGVRDRVAFRPSISGVKLEDTQITISFDHAGEELIYHNGKDSLFEIRVDGSWITVDPKINENEVKIPVEKRTEAIRYGFTNTFEPVLFSAGGQPVSSFELKISE